MMSLATYLDIKLRVAENHNHDIAWSERVGPPQDSLAFWQEYAWVIVNSGMKNTVARRIYDRITVAIHGGVPVSRVFGHPGKAKAIEDGFRDRARLYAEYMAAPDKIAYLATLPWIGGITKWHLAKNFGVDCAKPDRHLVRISASYGTDTDTLCRSLAEESGDRIGTVDLVLWRAATLGWI